MHHIVFAPADPFQMSFPVIGISPHELGHHREYGESVQGKDLAAESQFGLDINVVGVGPRRLGGCQFQCREIRKRGISGVEGKCTSDMYGNVYSEGSIEVRSEPERPPGSIGIFRGIQVTHS